MSMEKTAALHNLGCKVNAYETETMERMLKEAGYTIVDFDERADVYVINTCSVTNMADRKSRQMLHRAKKKNPDAVVVAAGCYVQTSTEKAKEDDAIDILIGNNQKHLLIEKLDEFFSGREKINSVIDIAKDREYESMGLTQYNEHTRAFVKVQDGCNQFCTYCIIPYARGRVRSRKLAEVIDEIRGLAANGYKEVVLTGIHLSSYGVDCGETLLHLIQEVNGIDGIYRIRLGSLEPGIVTEEFARELAGMEKICPHFHLSLQSGCNATLKRMNRRYTAEEYASKCELLRKYFKHPALTTDVIVGFPGETEEEFETTRAFLQQINFYEVHLFKYSKRQGTKAAVMPDQVSEEEKTRRSNILSSDLKKNKEEFESYYEGTLVEALLEEEEIVNGKRYFTGYTKEYVKVYAEADRDYTNEFKKIEFSRKLY